MEREEILTQYRLNPDAIVSYIEALEAQNKAKDARIEALEAQNKAKDARIEALEAQIIELKERINELESQLFKPIFHRWTNLCTVSNTMSDAFLMYNSQVSYKIEFTIYKPLFEKRTILSRNNFALKLSNITFM